VTLQGEIVGSGQAARAGPDDRDLPAGEFSSGNILLPGFTALFSSRPLERPYRDSFIELTFAAADLAGEMERGSPPL